MDKLPEGSVEKGAERGGGTRSPEKARPFPGEEVRNGHVAMSISELSHVRLVWAEGQPQQPAFFTLPSRMKEGG